MNWISVNNVRLFSFRLYQPPLLLRRRRKSRLLCWEVGLTWRLLRSQKRMSKCVRIVFPTLKASKSKPSSRYCSYKLNFHNRHDDPEIVIGMAKFHELKKSFSKALKYLDEVRGILYCKLILTIWFFSVSSNTNGLSRRWLRRFRSCSRPGNGSCPSTPPSVRWESISLILRLWGF